MGTTNKPEAWTQQARIATGELCQRCGGFNWPDDREGKCPQLCLRCRYADLQDELAAAGWLPEPAEASVATQRAEVAGETFERQLLIEAAQWVVEHGLIDGHSRKKLGDALAIADASEMLLRKERPCVTPK